MYHRLLNTILMLLVAVIALDACSTAPTRESTKRPAAEANSTVVIYVVKRAWHIDIGFNAADLHFPLASLRGALPDAHYLLFGFGDRHYLMSHGGSSSRLLGALWPGPGLVLLTGLQATPEAAFAQYEVAQLTVTTAQALGLEAFLWRTLATQHGSVPLRSHPVHTVAVSTTARSSVIPFFTLATPGPPRVCELRVFPFTASALSFPARSGARCGGLSATKKQRQQAATRSEVARRCLDPSSPMSINWMNPLTDAQRAINHRAACCRPDRPPSSRNSAERPLSFSAAAAGCCY